MAGVMPPAFVGGAATAYSPMAGVMPPAFAGGAVAAGSPMPGTVPPVFVGGAATAGSPMPGMMPHAFAGGAVAAGSPMPGTVPPVFAGGAAAAGSPMPGTVPPAFAGGAAAAGSPMPGMVPPAFAGGCGPSGAPGGQSPAMADAAYISTTGLPLVPPKGVVDKDEARRTLKAALASTDKHAGVMAKAHEAAAENGFPTVVHGDLEFLEFKLKQASVSKCERGGGGHGINKCRPTRATATIDKANSRGFLQGFGCGKHRNARKCGWEITYERCFADDGSDDTSTRAKAWLLHSFRTEHNHDLESVAEVMVTKTGRYIPRDFFEIGALLAKSHLSATTIDDVFKNKAREDGIPVTWNREDVRNAGFQPPAADASLDATGFAEELLKRKEEYGLGHAVKTDQSGTISGVVVEMDGAFADWAQGGDDNVLLFDPTHGTNRYGLKLCCFTTVNSSGMTKILAFALLRHEGIDDIEWAFRQFQTIFKKEPAEVFTDGAVAIASAFTNMQRSGIWKETKHMLCVFHISKNFYQHLRPLFISDVTRWKELHGKFWYFAKRSDSTFEDVFVAEFQAKVIDFVREHGRGSTRDNALRWLESLLERRHQWAATYTWRHCSWGIHSTQRSEAVHSAIKRTRLANSLGVRLLAKLTEYNADAHRRKDIDNVRKGIRNVDNDVAFPPCITDLRDSLTPYGYELLLAQAAQVMHYQREQATDVSEWDVRGNGVQGQVLQIYYVTYQGETLSVEDDVHYDNEGNVQCYDCDEDLGVGGESHKRRITSLDVCSCQLHNVLRIPCRHMLYLRMFLPASSVLAATPLLELCGAKWQRHDDALTKQLVHKLRTYRPLTTAPAAHAAATMTRAERTSYAMSEFRSVADVAAGSDELTALLVQCMPVLISALSANRPPELPAEPLQVEETTAAAPPPMLPTKDFASLTTALKSTLTPTDACLDESKVVAGTIDVFDERCVAVKWNNRNTGGWFVGYPEKASSVGGEYVATFTDGWTGAVQLTNDLRVSADACKSNQPKKSWVLLERKPDHADLDDETVMALLRFPAEKRQRGRPAAKRKKPAFGPTS